MSATLLVAIAAAASLTACARKQTDEEQIRAVFVEAAHAAEEKRVNDVMRAVSDRFEGEGLDRHGVKQLVAFHLLRGAWVAISLGGYDIQVHGDTADAVVDVVMVRSGKGRALSELLPENATVHRFTTRVERTKDGWKVASAAWRPVAIEDAVAGPQSQSSR